MDKADRIRTITEQDAEQVFLLEQRCFQDPWSEQLIRDAFYCHGGEAAGVFVDNRLCGYYFSGSVLDEGELMNLCVDETFRRHGYARSLLCHMEGKMQAKGVHCIYLEVRKKNTPARMLYLSQGYEEVGIRRGYYGDDDAVLMKKQLSKKGAV